MDCHFIPGRNYCIRDPDVTFEAGKIDHESGLIFGCMYHRMGGYVDPSHRLLNVRVSNETESPWDVIADHEAGQLEPPVRN